MSQYLGDISAYALAVSQGYTGTEEEYAELMASYATVGQTAVTAAQTATTKASEAATSATTATNKASEATTAATTATTKAGEAQADADAAALDASQAMSAASTATSKATEATTAAATAVSAKNDAVSANTAAQSAKTAAQTAQTGAETAAASVQSSAAQIQTNADDISELKEDLTQKANQDGYYADLVSGGSTQLLSDMVETDTTPYNYRTAGGSLEIGDRMKLKKIVGGSLAVNQLVTDPNFTDGTKWDSIARAYATVSVSNNEITMTVVETVSVNGITNSNSPAPKRAGHKLLFSAYVNPSKSVNVRFGASGSPAAGDYGLDSSPVAASTWTLMEKIGSCQSGNTTSNLNLYLDVGSVLTEGDTVKVKNFVCFDLTAMFGSTIADYVYSLETATAGAGVAWLKAHFPKIFDAGYIPYNAGALEHVSGLSEHKMTGFNQWDEEWEVGTINVEGNNSNNTSNIRSKNYIPCFPNTSYYGNFPTVTGVSSLFFYDGDGNFLSKAFFSQKLAFVTPENAKFMRFAIGASYGITYNHDICINLSDPAKNGTYKPYKSHSYPLDSTLTLRGLFKLDANNSLYADGDVYEYTGKVTRNTILRAYQSGDESLANAITDGTNTVVYSANASTEQADPYQHLQQCDPNGTEEYVSTGIVPVGHNSFYPENLRAKVEQLPWNFSNLIAPTEATFTATRNYVTGDLFIVQNVLYKATSNIANGGSITPNTNCTATTLAEIISALA